GRLARSAYTYIHLFMVAGIIVAAVADDFVLAHPGGQTEAGTTIAVLGGTALYLIGNLLFRWAISGKLPVVHLVGMAVLAVLIPVAAIVSPLALMAAATLVLVGIAAGEVSARRLSKPQLAPTDVRQG